MLSQKRILDYGTYTLTAIAAAANTVRCFFSIPAILISAKVQRPKFQVSSFITTHREGTFLVYMNDVSNAGRLLPLACS